MPSYKEQRGVRGQQNSKKGSDGRKPGMYRKLMVLEGEASSKKGAFQGGVGSNFKCHEEVAILILVIYF